MNHSFRISTSKRVEMIEDALNVYHEMKDHLEACTECADAALCSTANEIYQRMVEEKRKLKLVGYE